MNASYDENRRFFRADSLWVGGIAKDAAIADEVRGLDHRSAWSGRLEVLPNRAEAYQFQRLYRAFLRMAVADATWFATALNWFAETDEAPVFGPQVVVGVEAIARATQRSPSGALRLIEGGKLPTAKIAGEFVSTVEALRPYRRYGDSVARLAA
jgi:hypothetical protein